MEAERHRSAEQVVAVAHEDHGAPVARAAEKLGALFGAVEGRMAGALACHALGREARLDSDPLHDFRLAGGMSTQPAGHQETAAGQPAGKPHCMEDAALERGRGRTSGPHPRTQDDDEHWLRAVPHSR